MPALLLALASLVSPAHAQLPPGIPGLPPGLSLGGPQGDVRWAVEDVEAERFENGEGKGPELSSGDQVEVILVDGDRARIKKGDRYGWVPLGTLTTDMPQAATPAVPALDVPLLGTPSLEAPPKIGSGMGAGAGAR